MKILVVDDDPMVGMLIGAILEEEGYLVLNADNGVEAVELLEQEAGIGMVVSDMNMPLVSGLDLLHTLREQGVELPFVLLTGDSLEAIREKEPGLTACLMKDADLESRLPRLIREILG